MRKNFLAFMQIDVDKHNEVKLQFSSIQADTNIGCSFMDNSFLSIFKPLLNTFLFPRILGNILQIKLGDRQFFNLI